MNLVLSLSAKILILIAFGILAARLKIIDAVGKEKLSNLLVSLILPVSLISSSQQEFSTEHLAGMGQVAAIAAVYYLLTIPAGKWLGKALGFEARKRAMFTLLITFANIGFVGIPVATAIAGQTGTLYSAIYNCVFNLIYFSYGIYQLQADGGKLDFRQMLRQPNVWVAVCTVVLYLIPARFPKPVADSLSLLGGTMMPVSMLIIGAQIGQMDWKAIFTKKEAYLISLIRMLVLPLLMLGAMVLLHVDFYVGSTAVVLSAMPSGSLNVIMSQKFKTQEELASVTVMQNTVLMIATLPLFILLCSRVLG